MRPDETVHVHEIICDPVGFCHAALDGMNALCLAVSMF
jgi:hypothetical protein